MEMINNIVQKMIYILSKVFRKLADKTFIKKMIGYISMQFRFGKLDKY
jgi:hypothetical protein